MVRHISRQNKAASTRKASRVQETPTLTVNKLAEYAEADAQRRFSILQQFRFPESHGFPGMIYDRALERGKLALAGLPNVMSFAGMPPEGIQRNEAAWEALQKILPILTSTGRFEYLDKFASKNIFIEGVKISLRPDLLLFSNRRGQDRVGVVKFHFSSTRRLSEKAQGYVSYMMHEWLKSNHNHHVDRKMCMSVDVFSGSIISCSPSYIRTKNLIEMSCREIFDRWPYISPKTKWLQTNPDWSELRQMRR